MVSRCWSEGRRVDLTPWFLIKSEIATQIRKRFAETYQRDLVPFAHRQDNDDTACFEKGFGDEVKIIHDFASPGWESHEKVCHF